MNLDFVKVLRLSFPVPVVGLSALALSLAFAAENIKTLPPGFALEKKFELDL